MVLCIVARYAFAGQLQRLPTWIGIEMRHFAGDFVGAGPEILLIDDAIVIDDEGHDPGDSISGWEGDKSEAGDHVSVEDVVVSAVSRGRALCFQNAIEVAVIGCAAPACLGAVAVASCLHHEWTDRAFVLAWFGGPIEAITLAGAAQELLRVFDEAIVIAVLLRIFSLCVDIFAAHL